MPRFKVTDSKTGQTAIIESAFPPSEAELEQYFAPKPELPGVQPRPIPNPAEQYGTATEWTAGGLASNYAKDIGPTIADTVKGAASLIGSLNPVSTPDTLLAAVAAAPTVIKGLYRNVQEAVADPYGTAIDIGQAMYDRPAMTSTMLSPAARMARMPRLATAMDVPALAAKAGGGLAKGAGKRWMGGVAKISSDLKKENPFDIREVLLDEAIVPTERGADRASRLIQAETAEARNVVDRTRTLRERQGPEGAILPPETPPSAVPLEQTGSGPAVNPNLARDQFGRAQETRTIPAVTGTTWGTLSPEPLMGGTAAQVSGTAGSPAWGIRPGSASPVPPPPTPPIARAARPAPGTEELRAAIERIDPAVDTDNAMRNAFQKKLEWYESQVPNPVQESRIDQIKRQLQDRVSWGVRQKELSNETLADKKLAVGARRVENEMVPAVAPRNQRIGRLVAAEEAAAARGQAYQNLDVTPLSLLLGGGMGMGSYAMGHPGLAAGLGVAPFLLRQPTIGGYGAIGMWKGGKALGSLGQIPSALGVSAESLRREAEASLLANGSTEKP